MSVPCNHAAHRYDVAVQEVETPFGWQRLTVRVPCEHARHRADRQRVVAYEGAEPFDLGAPLPAPHPSHEMPGVIFVD